MRISDGSSDVCSSDLITLKAKTRLGDDSVVAIPLREIDAFDPAAEPDYAQAKAWFLRAMSVSRKGIVKPLQREGVTEGWKTGRASCRERVCKYVEILVVAVSIKKKQKRKEKKE